MTIKQTYQLQLGDTLGRVAAAQHVSLADLLAANQQITHPDLVQVGEVINIPGPAATPPAGPNPYGAYDGLTPAPNTISTNRAALITPPLTGTAANRSPDLYNAIINQFAVGYNPRYLPGGGCTYCNIFVWDVTRALGCPIPHWVLADGAIADPQQPGAQEININGGALWMLHHGIVSHGWLAADAATAQQYANEGKVAVVLWANPTGGHGHTAMVRPGTITSRGPAIAQAGSTNFNFGHLADGFGHLAPPFYVHA